MKFKLTRIKLSDIRTMCFEKIGIPVYVIAGALLNIIIAFIMNVFKLPLYFDTIGTVAVSVLCGIYPGIVTAVLTNVVCMLFNPTAIYYMIINVMIAQIASLYSYKMRQQKKMNFFVFVFAVSFAAGIVGMALQWILLGEPQFVEVVEMAAFINEQLGINYVFCTFVINLLLNILDKSVTIFIALSIVKIIPESYREAAFEGGWRQKPLSVEEREKIKRENIRNRKSLQRKITTMLVVDSFAIAVIMGITGLRLYYSNLKSEYRTNVKNAAKLASEVVNADSINWYLNSGKKPIEYNNSEYNKTNKLLSSIRDTVPGIEYVYIYQIKEDGCYIVFHTNETFQTEMYIGEVIPFDKSFDPYLPALLAGEKIDNFERADVFGFIITAYEPIFDSKGKCVGYAGADISESYIGDYMRVFTLRVILIFSGFFILILGYGLWMTGFNLIYPINSMASCLDNFIEDNTNQEKLDENVKNIKSLNIRTGDDVEKLYRSICHMASATAEQMRDIRHYADANAKMQNGLIITMADMVENRDSETGAHSQKIAAYVKIILEGLKRKGYYASKLTPKYIGDVVTSAPLHDVGKINIPDAILNKPGKLTPEEFEIMKTHTTAGKQIMEHAISTVSGENYLKEARNMAAYHHERWDGKGYPEGLHGEVIPLSARIMSVADVFDALVSKRVYKPAFPLEQAIEILKEGAGTQFDPKCVEVFLESMDEVKEVLIQYQNL
ncbi:HD domain-containing phosphohydrolase [Butyrivibrio sp. WCE2006]|uniref:HD domain-containing phosphohydrolase n=1 Tax=Butyrivibrio sp. WCE2006 TaxID=1410611 RepID=UPI001FA798B9|nr:HD domain-containing phosphohydrolase [Butyrivibrio sp. WCE2006]